MLTSAEYGSGLKRTLNLAFFFIFFPPLFVYEAAIETGMVSPDKRLLRGHLRTVHKYWKCCHVEKKLDLFCPSLGLEVMERVHHSLKEGLLNKTRTLELSKHGVGSWRERGLLPHGQGSLANGPWYRGIRGKVDGWIPRIYLFEG